MLTWIWSRTFHVHTNLSSASRAHSPIYTKRRVAGAFHDGVSWDVSLLFVSETDGYRVDFTALQDTGACHLHVPALLRSHEWNGTYVSGAFHARFRVAVSLFELETQEIPAFQGAVYNGPLKKRLPEIEIDVCQTEATHSSVTPAVCTCQLHHHNMHNIMQQATYCTAACFVNHASSH